MKLGTRFPQARAGQAEGSIVTGQGVKALMAGFDSQIKVIQSILGEAIGEAISIAFATDEAYFPTLSREVSATANGVPYKLKYKPSSDINGNYGVTVEYGLMAGLDPNRAFGSMRNVKSQVLVFDRIQRVWHGCDWQPTDEEAQKDLESRKFSDIRREIAQLWKAINALRKAKQRKRKQNAENTESEPKLEQEPEDAKESSEPSLADEFEKLLSDLKAS